MAFIPTIKLYSESDLYSYTFPIVSSINIPQTEIKGTFIEGIRGIGGIFIKGSLSSFDLIFKGTLLGNEYEDITSKIDALESAVVAGTKYILKLEKSLTQTYSFNVIRIKPIEYPESLRNNYQEYNITFKANAW